MVSLLSTLFLEPPAKEVGEGFRPTDYELVNHFLKLIIVGDHHRVRRIPVVDIYKYEPWDLRYHSGLSLSCFEWYFFHRNHLRKGGRAKRATKAGYWKSTGRPRRVKHEVTRRAIGEKKSLVFHVGRTPRGVGTEWIMHEYSATLNLPNQEDFVLCKLIKRPKKKSNIRQDDGRDDQLGVTGSYRGTENPEVTDQYLSSLEGIGCNVSNLGGCGSVSQMDFGLQNQSSDLMVDDTKITSEGGTGWLMISEPEIYADDPIIEELDAQILWNLWSSCGFNELSYTSSSTTESNVDALHEFESALEDFLVSTKEGSSSSPMNFAFKSGHHQEADHSTTAERCQISSSLDVMSGIGAT